MTELIITNYALDTFYLLVLGMMVMFMCCGFSMLEAGFVRSRNTSEILTKNVALYAIACVMYLLFGYALMYTNATPGGWFPALGIGIGPEHSAADLSGAEAPTFAARADFFFQMVFVATAMSIVSGAVAERMRLWAFLVFAVVMSAFIYPIQGMWSWGGGWLSAAGFYDFAGAGIVHLCGASAALAGVLLLGPRRGKYSPSGQIYAIPGCNMPLAALGMFVLWFGWFGFNGGSELRLSTFDDANAVAQVFVNTNISASCGVLGALLLSQLWFGKADLTMVLNGALAGLVTITADPLSPSAEVAALLGFSGGLLVIPSIVLLDRLKIDDPVGAISVHGVCGIWGVLAVALTNPEATFGTQLLGIVAIAGWTFVVSFGVWAAIKALLGIRVSESSEIEGIDAAETGIEAYPEFTSR